MPKTLTSFFVTALFFLFLIPIHSYADKFFEDNDAFFLKYLKQQKFPLDTSASAIVLYECTSYDLLAGQLRVRKIIKIIKKSGSEFADIAISILNSRYSNNITTVNRVHGITYNLDGETIVKQEIDEDNVDMERSGLINEKKISMPAVREGSVIDYSYEINGIGFSKWKIQESIPKIYTKLELSIPKEVNMATDDRSVPVFIEVNENKRSAVDELLPFSYTYSGSDRKGQAQQSWVRRNVPSFDNEPYLPCESNYRENMVTYVKSARFINFEDLSAGAQAYAMEANVVFDYGVFNTWDKINKALLEDKYFYQHILLPGLSVNEKSDELAGNDTSQLNVAKKIYKFVRDSITRSYSSMFANKDISKVLKERSGNSAEINLLLIALMRRAGLKCSPVILATKDNATPSAEKVELIKYNYTMCQLRVNREKYYLDAAEKFNPFGRIPPDCLNGYARIIDKTDTCGVMFKPEMAKEKALYVVTTTNNTLNNYTLNFKLQYSDEVSIDNRTKWIKDTTEVKKYIIDFLKGLSFETRLKEYKVLNLNDPEKQLTLDFSISMVWPESGTTIYLNPYAIKLFESDPFKNPKRKNPIELPATENLTYTFNLKLPDGYTVDEMPKSGIIKIDENNQYKNMLEYNKETNTLNVYSRLQLQRIFYKTDEYDMLKEFFQKMAEEQQKTMVIKKQ